jgi:hypothetical protein
MNVEHVDESHKNCITDYDDNTLASYVVFATSRSGRFMYDTVQPERNFYAFISFIAAMCLSVIGIVFYQITESWITWLVLGVINMPLLVFCFAAIITFIVKYFRHKKCYKQRKNYLLGKNFAIK